MIIFSGRLCDLLVMDKQRFADFSLLAPKAPGRFRSGQESGRVFGPYDGLGHGLLAVWNGFSFNLHVRELVRFSSTLIRRTPLTICDTY